MAKPKLALIPASQGTKLYSVLPADGVGDFNFSRNTVATRINKDGLIETVAVGKSRLNYPLIDGVVNGCPSHLLEPSRLQKIQYSEAFDNAYWTKGGASVTSGFTSPDGTANAFKLVEDTSTSNHNIYSNNITVTLGSEYTVSLYVKKAERSIIRIDGGYRLTLDATFNLNTLQVTGVGTIEAFANDWYKLTASGVGEISNGGTNIFVFLLDNSGTQSYQGNGTSGAYIYGAQLEQGSFPTSYIPNYGNSAGITRAAETANGAGDASTFNDSEGVLMVEMSSLVNNGSSRQISLSDGSSSTNKVSLIYTSTSNQLQAFIRSGGSIAFNVSEILSDTTNNNKIALKYKANDFALWVNGIELENDTIGNAPTSLNVLDFDDADGSSDFYGSAKQIQYFDSALNDSDLEKITSWTSFTDLANGQTYSIK